MPQVVCVTHQNIVRRCRIPHDWVIPPLDSHQRLLVVNIRAIQAAFAHAASEMQHEIGGYITGYPAYDDERGIEFIYVDKVVRGIYESTPTHVTLLAQGYFAAHTMCIADNTFVIGWYHSHPHLTVFFSSTDHHNHHQNFVRPHEIAMVVDPAQGNVAGTGDVVAVQSALNQRNFALFVWNSSLDKVVRATQSIVYVDAAPHEVPAEALAGVSPDNGGDGAPYEAPAQAQAVVPLSVVGPADDDGVLVDDFPHGLPDEANTLSQLHPADSTSSAEPVVGSADDEGMILDAYSLPDEAGVSSQSEPDDPTSNAEPEATHE